MKAFLLLILTVSCCLCFGQDTLFFDNGWKPTTKMYAEFFRIDKKENGKWTRMDYFYKTKQLQMKGTYTSLIPEVEDGYFEWYHANGKLKHKGNYANGKHVGEHLWYNDNGNLEAKENYKEGKLDGTYEEYYPDNKLIVKTTFASGLQNGWTIYYREDGIKHSEGNFKNGNRNGEWKYYDENGNIENTTIFKIDYEIKEAKMFLQLPNDEWFLADNSNNKGLTQYIFKRNEIIDSNGRTIVPAIMLYIEDAKDYKQDLMVYSLQKRLAFSKMNIQINKILTPNDNDFPFSFFENAIFITASYSDKGFDHIFYMVHIINKEDKGIQLYMDMTKDIADEYEKEFWITLQSIKKAKL
jgi:antitoxin component YwqK of YwqJK toxin-antitoxin module